MIKSFSALAVMLALGAAVVALPGFAPQVKADESVALAKSDRLPLRSMARDCSSQVWPDLATSCLRSSQAGIVREARLVTARR
jgi:hypothetical protein